MASSYCHIGQFLSRVNRNKENVGIRGLGALKDETVYLQLLKEKIVGSLESRKLITTWPLSKKKQIKAVTLTLFVTISV